MRFPKQHLLFRHSYFDMTLIHMSHNAHNKDTLLLSSHTITCPCTIANMKTLMHTNKMAKLTHKRTLYGSSIWPSVEFEVRVKSAQNRRLWWLLRREGEGKWNRVLRCVCAPLMWTRDEKKEMRKEWEDKSKGVSRCIRQVGTNMNAEINREKWEMWKGGKTFKVSPPQLRLWAITQQNDVKCHVSTKCSRVLHHNRQFDVVRKRKQNRAKIGRVYQTLCFRVQSTLKEVVRLRFHLHRFGKRKWSTDGFTSQWYSLFILLTLIRWRGRVFRETHVNVIKMREIS